MLQYTVRILRALYSPDPLAHSVSGFLPTVLTHTRGLLNPDENPTHIPDQPARRRILGHVLLHGPTWETNNEDALDYVVAATLPPKEGKEEREEQVHQEAPGGKGCQSPRTLGQHR